MLGFFGGFWDDWNLLHSVTFDGPQRLIIIAEEVFDTDVRVDLYSDWKEWLRVRDYAKFPRAIRTIGGDPTETGQRAGDQYFLTNGWRIRTWEGDHQLDIAGSLFVDGTSELDFDQLGRSTGTINVPTLDPHNIILSTVRSNLVTTVETGAGSGGGLTDDDRTTIENTETIVTSIQTIIDNLPDSGSLTTIQAGINIILSSSHIFSVGITGGDILSASTELTESDGFYDGMGVILTSGSTGTTRMINSYTQLSGTIFFETDLPFTPISGSQAVLITQHKAGDGGRG